MSGSEHFKVADQAAAVFLILEDDKQSCVMNPSPSDRKKFLSTKAAASITSVGKKWKEMFSVNPEVFQDESQPDEWAQKNHLICGLTFFYTAKQKLIPALSIGRWPCKGWKRGWKCGIFKNFIYVWIIQIAAFIIGELWKSNCRSLSRTCFFSDTCRFLKNKFWTNSTTNSEMHRTLPHDASCLLLLLGPIVLL